MVISGYMSFVEELRSTFQRLRNHYIDSRSLNTLRAYFICDTIARTCSEGQDTVVRFVPLRCSFLYVIYFGNNSTCVLLEFIISCSNVEFYWNLEILILKATLNSVQPSLPLVRNAENMRNERKARSTSVRLDLLGQK